MDVLNRSKLKNYANAAAELAESLSNDLTKNKSKKVSNETIVKLNNFVIAANEVSALVDFLNVDPKAQVN